MYRMARIIESTLLSLDDMYWHQRTSGVDTTITERLIDRCVRLTDKYQRTLDCPFCDGTIRQHTTACEAVT